MDNLIFLKNNYIVVFIAIIVTLGCMYLDSIISGTKYELSSYIKNCVLVLAISLFIVFVNTLEGDIEPVMTGIPSF